MGCQGQLSFVNTARRWPGQDAGMNPSSTLHQAQLLTQRTELLARMANERGGLVSRTEVAADHFDNSFPSRAQIQTER